MLRYLVTQMEVFNFKSTDLSEQLPLLSVPLQTVMAVGKSRSEMCGFVHCKDGHLECGSAALHEQKTTSSKRSEDCASKYGAFTDSEDVCKLLQIIKYR